jgi:hypothetical protein
MMVTRKSMWSIKEPSKLLIELRFLDNELYLCASGI